jgi:hypothetical protein
MLRIAAFHELDDVFLVDYFVPLQRIVSRLGLFHNKTFLDYVVFELLVLLDPEFRIIRKDILKYYFDHVDGTRPSTVDKVFLF